MLISQKKSVCEHCKRELIPKQKYQIYIKKDGKKIIKYFQISGKYKSNNKIVCQRCYHVFRKYKNFEPPTFRKVRIWNEENYNKFSQDIGEDFVKNPDLVMLPKYAFKILIDGFKTGAFTGRKISNYINESVKDYRGARRCINGTDRDQQIANYAELFEELFKK
jgi:hypothetical protein